MKILMIAIGCMLGIFLQAQTTGEIQGKVTDASGLPLIGAHVYVELGDKQIGTAADFNGKFRIKPLSSGTYNLHVSMLSYTDFTMTGIEVTSDHITILDVIKLSENAEVIGPAVISEWIDPLISKDEPQKLTIKAADFERMPVKNNIVGLITALTTDVKSDPDTGELFFRGSRSGSTQFIVDGIKFTSGNPRIPTSAMSSVSVYTGGVPAKYGDVTGGVIVMETKSYFELYNQRKRDLIAQGMIEE